MTASSSSQNISKITKPDNPSKIQPQYQQEHLPKRTTKIHTTNNTYLYTYLYLYILIYIYISTFIYLFIHLYTYSQLPSLILCLYLYILQFLHEFFHFTTGAYNQNFGNLTSKKDPSTSLGRAKIRYPALLVEDICSKVEGRKLPKTHP